MKKKLLVIEPHSDDSIISAGGFIQKNKNQYDLHFVLIAASSNNLKHSKELTHQNVRLNEYENYVKLFKGTWHRKSGIYDLPLDEDCNLDIYPRKNLVNIIENLILKIKPNIILVCGPSFHHDHTAVYEASIAALRPTIKYCPEEIIIAENPTYVHSLNPYNEFSSNFYVELTEKQINDKINTFKKIFPSQVRKSGNNLSPEGIKSWARYRGIESRTEYAEAFYQFYRKK
jgi:LmbE family N-acetylglucosaminyl deacetylase